MSGDTDRVDVQTTSASSRCGLNLVRTSQRHVEQHGLFKLGHEPAIFPAVIERAFAKCQSGRPESRSDLGTLPRLTPSQTEKSPSSGDPGSRPYELVKAHNVTQVDRRPPRHDGPALATMAHRLMTQATRGPCGKWTGYYCTLHLIQR